MMSLASGISDGIEQFKNGGTEFTWDQASSFPWTSFGIFQVLKICDLLRKTQYDDHFSMHTIKPDNSPTIPIESAIEGDLASALQAIPGQPVLIGEETGGILKREGIEVIIDPIDGTRAFLSGSDRYATVITFTNQGEPFLSLIGNPSSGEIFISTESGSIGMLTSMFFADTEQYIDLPIAHRDKDAILLDIHPSREAQIYIDSLYSRWGNNELQLVRSSGGSPSLLIAEASKGHFIYLNIWSDSGTNPYDLIAAKHIIECSGGVILNQDGLELDPVHHKGPFIAGQDKDKIMGVLNSLPRY